MVPSRSNTIITYSDKSKLHFHAFFELVVEVEEGLELFGVEIFGEALVDLDLGVNFLEVSQEIRNNNKK